VCPTEKPEIVPAAALAVYTPNREMVLLPALTANN